MAFGCLGEVTQVTVCKVFLVHFGNTSQSLSQISFFWVGSRKPYSCIGTVHFVSWAGLTQKKKKKQQQIMVLDGNQQGFPELKDQKVSVYILGESFDIVF